MKSFQSLLLILLVIGASACKPIEELTNSKSTVLVDLNAVAKALGRDEAMKQEIAGAEQQLREQLGQIAGDLKSQVKQEQEKLDAKSGDEDRARVEQLALQAQQAFRQQQVVAQQKAGQVRSELINKFREEVKAAAEPVAREKGARLVRLIGADVLWFDPALDITGDVIARMRADHQ